MSGLKPLIKKESYEKFDTQSFAGMQNHQVKIKSAIKEKVYEPLNKLFLKSIPDIKNSGSNMVDVLLGRMTSENSNNTVQKQTSIESSNVSVKTDYSTLKRQELVDIVAHYYSNIVINFFSSE